MSRVSTFAVIVSVLAHMAFGYLWYGLLFHTPWMGGGGAAVAALDPSDPIPYAIDAGGWLVLSYVLAAVLAPLGADSGGRGATVGALLGAALAFPPLAAHYAFLGVASVVMLIDGVNVVLGMALSGAILAGWPRRAAAT